MEEKTFKLTCSAGNDCLTITGTEKHCLEIKQQLERAIKEEGETRFSIRIEEV